MIDLRYHVYSLAAVFFALAIGIVIGTSFVGKPADRAQLIRISERYERNLRAMQTEMSKQQDSVRAARSDAGRSEKLCAALMPVALKDRLLYRNVAIIQTGDYDELASNLRTVVQSVGGQVTNVTKISSFFDFEDPEAVSDVLSATGIVPERGENGRTAILHAIAESVVTSKNMERLPILEEKKVITLSGDYTHWNKCVVIIGGSASEDGRRAEMIDVPLLGGLVGFNATVVGCEPLDAVTSYVPVWKRLDIATVDNADRTLGKVALICGLSGEITHFGQKPTADLLIPRTLGVPSE